MSYDLYGPDHYEYRLRMYVRRVPLNEREAHLLNARPAMPEPKLTRDDVLDAHESLKLELHIADAGISALAFVQRWGSCSLHGAVTDEVEVSHGVQLAEDKIRCWTCHADFGITKRCVVEAVGPVTREE